MAHAHTEFPRSEIHTSPFDNRIFYLFPFSGGTEELIELIIIKHTITGIQIYAKRYIRSLNILDFLKILNLAKFTSKCRILLTFRLIKLDF